VDKGWRVQHAQSGGEALDIATQIPPHVVVAKESLPDLTGSMVVKTIKAERAQFGRYAGSPRHRREGR